MSAPILPIAHNRPALGLPEAFAAQRVIDSGWLAQGAEVAAFEREMCAVLGLPEGHAVALSSGTAALFMALWSLGAKGQRVAVPVYSCAALRNAVLMAGAEPVAIDVAEDSPHIDLDQAVSAGTQAVIAAHMFGIPMNWPAGELPIPVIEDCAQSLGARINGHPVGLRGAAAVFSFYATKMITSGGQGGMLVSRDGALADAVRDYREFDNRRDRLPRFNFQMTDLQAAIGRAQLQQLGQFIERRREVYSRYHDAGLPLWPPPPAAGAEPCRYRAILRLTESTRMLSALQQAGIKSIVPVEEWELLDDGARFARASALCRSTVSLPIYPSLARGDVDQVIDAALSS